MPLQDITVGRYDQDPQAQGVIRPKDDSWQLVIDRDGYPHLYVRIKLTDMEPGEPQTGWFCVEDMLIDKMTIPDIMKGEFGGKLPPEEELAAYQEFLADKGRTGIPCPR